MRGLVFSLFLLAGCTTTQPQGIRVEYVDKPVIQQVECVKARDVPQRPAKLSATPTPLNVETALAVAMAKVSEWSRYGDKADIILKSCSTK